MVSELNNIKNIFDEYKIPLSMEWLESCIEWCKSENLPPNYSVKDLRNMVYQQWLILDLRDVEISSLPRNLPKEKKYLLTGVYYVQLMQIIDISKPKLWQLQRIRNNLAKNTDMERDFGKRCLQLTLTDGVQEIEAMEFKPVACLNINLKPGTKLKLLGPIMVRNGRLMLETENVKDLGGSVDELLVKNAAENVLARALGLPENPNPHSIDEKVLEVPQDNTDAQINPIITPQNLNRNISNLPPSRPPQSDYKQIAPKPIINQQIPPEFEVDDELLRELETDFEDRSNVNTVATAEARNRGGCTSPDLFDESDDELLNEHLNQIAMIENTFDTHVPERQNSTKVVQDVAVTSTNAKKNDEIVVLDDTFDEIDIDAHLDRIDQEMALMPCSTQKNPSKSPELNKSKLTTHVTRLAHDDEVEMYTSNNDKEKSPELKRPKLAHYNRTQERKKKLDKDQEPIKLTASKIFDDDADDDFEETQCNWLPKNMTDLQAGSSTISSTIHSHPKSLIKSIAKIKELIPTVSQGKFFIDAKFTKVMEKLQTTNNGYYLVIEVADQSGTLVLQVCSTIVANLAEITPQEMAEMREAAISGDKDTQTRIFNALIRIREGISNLSGKMEVQVTRGKKYPVILSV